ncbi:MAG TPA: DUF998 domain-containing protein [Nocardioides sp.]|nr:DUF998 domain-containing protein [Nocardioides sp.]
MTDTTGETDVPLLERSAPLVPTAHQDRTLKAAAVVGVGGFAIAALVTGLVTPGYDARREAISGLAALDSPHAWIMIVGFVFSAVGLLSAGLLLWKHVPGRAARVGSGLVVVAAALMAVAGLARQDCSDQLVTCKDYGEAVDASGSYWVHQQASLVGFVLLIIAFFLLARGLRGTGRTGLAVASRTIGVTCVTGTVLLVVTPPLVVDNYGVVQRLFIALLFGWPVAAALLSSRRRITP